jgi:hypothetical protein
VLERTRADADCAGLSDDEALTELERILPHNPLRDYARAQDGKILVFDPNESGAPPYKLALSPSEAAHLVEVLRTDEADIGTAGMTGPMLIFDPTRPPNPDGDPGPVVFSLTADQGRDLRIAITEALKELSSRVDGHRWSCPHCAQSHTRGFFPLGTTNHRCLKCGYTGAGGEIALYPVSTTPPARPPATLREVPIVLDENKALVEELLGVLTAAGITLSHRGKPVDAAALRPPAVRARLFEGMGPLPLSGKPAGELAAMFAALSHDMGKISVHAKPEDRHIRRIADAVSVILDHLVSTVSS